MKLSIQVASTSQTVNVFIQDSSSTTGAGLTGLLFNTASLTAYYMLPRAAAVSITLATLAAVTSAWSSGGFKEIDSTNAPGWYRLDIPDAALASGRFVGVHLKGATNMAPLPLEIELTAWNNQDSVRGGLTSLPNAAASAVGGLPLSVDSSGRVDVLKINGTSQTARDIGASVLLSSGTGTGQLDFTSGIVKNNLSQILGTALTESGAGRIEAGFKAWFDVGIPASSMNVISRVTLVDTVTTYSGNTVQTGDSFARIGALGAGLTAVGDTAGTTTLLTRVPGTVQPQTGDSFARIGALGVGLTSVGVATNADKTGYSLLAGQLTIKKNTQITITFPMTDATTHLPKTGLTVTAQRTIDGAAVGACANAPTELSGGLYTLVLAATDVNGTMISLALSSAGADTRWIGFVTQA